MLRIYPERPGCYQDVTNWIWQVDAISRLYRSRHEKAGTTKAALVKATKHKANPATNEVRVEKRKTLHSRTKGNRVVIQIQKALWRKLQPLFDLNKMLYASKEVKENALSSEGKSCRPETKTTLTVN